MGTKGETTVSRRGLMTAVAGGAAVAASGGAAAQEAGTTGSANGSASASGTATGGSNASAGNATGNASAGNASAGNNSSAAAGGGGTKTVQVGPGGNYVFTPGTDSALQIRPGTTVNFVWESDNHNIVVGSQPDGASWSGHEPIENTGFSYSYTFTTKGEYDYHCVPHQSLGMVGSIVVTDNPTTAGGSGEVDPEDMGVPLQSHYVGAATILVMLLVLAFTFFLVKYGESPNAKGGN